MNKMEIKVFFGKAFPLIVYFEFLLKAITFLLRRLRMKASENIYLLWCIELFDE